MEQPKPNEIYKHFKGSLYKVITLAIHSETGEIMVVYQALYGDFAVYVRPLTMFMSRVDSQKYPDVEQEYRFQRIDAVINNDLTEMSGPDNTSDNGTLQDSSSISGEVKDSSEQLEIDPLVLEFLDADSIAQKRNILTALHHKITDEMINTLSVSLDLVVEEGDLEERYQQLKNCIVTKEKFECERP